MTGVVTELHLRGAYLSGSLSANSNLFIFNHLKYLNLSYNYFDSFSFLPELGKLRMLEVLDLSDMDLVDEMELELSENEFIASFFPSAQSIKALFFRSFL